MKRVLLVSAFGAVLVACGGGGGGGPSFKDPASIQFSYGAPQAPALNEQTSASTGESGMGDALGVQSSDGATAQAQSESVANLPNDMSGVFANGLPMTGSLAQARTMVAGRAAAYLAGDTVVDTSGFDNPNCWTVTASSVTYDHCTVTVSGTTGMETVTINGSFNRSLGRVFWDATVSISMTEATTSGTVTMHGSNRLSGDIAFVEADRTIKGFARSDVAVSASAGAQSMSAAVTYNLDLDLVYSDAVTCSSRIVSGTATLKRVWGERPSGADATSSQFSDASVQFTWQSCGLVQVSWGVLQ